MKRYWPQKFHLFLASGIFLGILVLTCLIVSRHNRRFDLTREKIHSISPETIDVLTRMAPDEIVVRAFFSNEDDSRRDFQIFLRDMATHHPHFRHQILDPDRSPSEARRYQVDSYRTTLIEYQGREERIQDVSEEAFTNALIRLAHPEKRTLCFTTGHGEIDLSDTDRTGLSQWRSILEGRQYVIKEVQLLAEGVPSDCSALVLAGPHYELLPKELDLLQKYPETGKGLFLLIDPMDPGTGKSYSELVKSFGLKLGNDVIVDKVSRVFGGDYLVPLITKYAHHPITEKFRVATFLPIARTVRKASEVPLGIKVTELAFTSAGSWAETNLKMLENGEAELNPDQDLVGPVPVAAVVELQEGIKGSRVAVVGDSDFVTNTHLRVSGNKDFALNILQWLVRDDRWIAIRSREPRFEPLFLPINQSAGVAAFAIGGIPFTALFAGSVGIWMRRRRSV